MRILDCEQGSSAWAKARKGVATASNADRIITPAEGKFSARAYDYACELLASHLLPAHWWIEDDSFQSAAMQNGSRTEQEARAYFELDSGLVVRQVGFVLSDDGRSGCSPDGVIGAGDTIEELLELKCPLHKTQVKYLDKGELPQEYKPQVHWSLVVTGAKCCHFMSYAPGLPQLILRVEPNDYTQQVRERQAEFWKLFDKIKTSVESHRLPSKPAAQPTEHQYAFPKTG